MDFSAAWDAFSVNAVMTVSLDGPVPSETSGMLYNCWVSNNFTGTLVEKISGTVRQLRFELPENVDGNIIGYVIDEGLGHQFVESATTLAGAQAAKWAEIKAKRELDEFGGCMGPLGMVDTDAVSQQRITSTWTFSTLIGSSFGVGWTMADNGVVWHTKAQFDAMALAVGQHVSNAHSRSQSLRSAVYALATIGAVNAFDVDAQWAAFALAITTESSTVLLTEGGIYFVA